jgi:hypothetical protein
LSWALTCFTSYSPTKVAFIEIHTALRKHCSIARRPNRRTDKGGKCHISLSLDISLSAPLIIGKKRGLHAKPHNNKQLSKGIAQLSRESEEKRTMKPLFIMRGGVSGVQARE